MLQVKRLNFREFVTLMKVNMFQRDCGEMFTTPSALLRSSFTSLVSPDIFPTKKYFRFLGWSVFTEISLLRGEDDPDGSCSHLGELLKRKVEEGVTVLLLIWNDKSSGSVFGREGMMK